MLDFTSSLYLDFRHASGSLRPWAQLTTGVPAVLAPPPGADAVAAGLAALQGCEAATLGASTLHLFWDVFALLGGARTALYVDEGAYPIGRWATAQTVVRGTPVRYFPHRDAAGLRRMIEAQPTHRPVVLADGICVCCGSLTPLAAYRDAIRPYGGLLVVDDTQALGLMGHSPTPAAPYGYGGGGSLQHGGLGGPDIILVCSLAKAFGVPMAALSGSAEMVARLEAAGPTRVHCSPPSAAAIHAAMNALALNERIGDRARRQLVQAIRFFRQQLGGLGIRPSGGLLPIQSLPALPVDAAQDLYQRLLAANIRTVLKRGPGNETSIAFVLTARHTPAAIQHAVQTLATLLQPAQATAPSPP